MRGKKEIKFFLTLVISTVFLLSFSQFGTSAYESVFKQGDVYPKGTKIGAIDVSGLSEAEAEDKIAETIQSWQKENVITVHLNDMEKQFDNHAFQFDIQKSVDLVQNGQENPVYVLLNENMYQTFFNSIHSSLVDDVNHEKVKQDLITIANGLDPENLDVNLLTYIPQDKAKTIVLSESTFEDGKQYSDLNNWVNEVGSIPISAYDTFSLLTVVQDKGLFLSDDSVNILSSLLYQVVLQTNFDIVERHKGLTLPSFIELGYEARVVPDEMDFMFVNPNHCEYELQFKNSNGNVVISLTGYPFYYHYKVETTNLETYEPRTIVQYSSSTQGQEIVKEEGSDGYSIKVYRETLDDDGIIDAKLIAEDYYAPVYRVVVKDFSSQNQDEPLTEDDEIIENDETNENASQDDDSTQHNEDTSNDSIEPKQNNEDIEQQNEGLFENQDEFVK